MVRIDPLPADKSWIEKIHPIEYIEGINSKSPKEGLRYLEPDTPISPHSYETALLAAGGVWIDWDVHRRKVCTGFYSNIRRV